ncbi:methyltransferase domain-containing protein [Agrobacterium rhizogenes]|uniref:methyltransferase domain-containing protein n=1 Tax=Rhizobium rhizogenes TaxID=359 RepID=UPI001573C735|nr:methyltransferase domain-containing protein [Rhizobium rhizogenes]NTG48908.1 methyltransferase domain-containing protein [Rhizobium rhizogenes]
MRAEVSSVAKTDMFSKLHHTAIGRYGKNMWASKTDYSKLYGPDYFGKQNGSVSFDIGALPAELITFCLTRNVEAVLDVGSGSGSLKNVLADQGFAVAACDYKPAHQDSVHFDLTATDDQQTAVLANELSRKFSGGEYVVTCFDVLEHIDAEDVATAVANLHTMTSEWLVASISTRPSSRGNAYHSTILPFTTWKRIFEVSGFEIVDGEFTESGNRLAPTQVTDPDLALVAHWASADLFGDHSKGEPSYLVAKKRANPDVSIARQTIIEILDISFRKVKRQAFALKAPKFIGLNIHHFQDFLNFRPLLDVIERSHLVAFVRKHTLLEDELQLVAGYFKKCGVTLVSYERIVDIDWRLFDMEVLLSAAESTVAFNHALSLQLVEAAKMHGIPCILLQHGIWSEPAPDRQIYFASETIWSWGGEQQQFLNRTGHSVAGTTTTYGNTERNTFFPIGSPKFCDSLIDPNPEVVRWRLGIDVSRFEKIALIGTNLKWGAHQTDKATVISKLKKAVDSNRDTLFLIKPHPSERYTDYSDLRADNTFLMDDILLGCMDLSMPRLLAGVSTVVSSLSTLLLDGAVTDKRCLQYDTGNKLSYANCEIFSLDDISAAIKNEKVRSFRNKDFVAAYNEADNTKFYGEMAGHLSNLENGVHQNSDAISYSMLKSSEDLWRHSVNLTVATEGLRNEVEVLRNEHAELQDIRTELQTTVDATSAETADLRKSLEDVTAENHLLKQGNETALAEIAILRRDMQAYSNSMSWKLTGPYRYFGLQMKHAVHMCRALPKTVAEWRGLRSGPSSKDASSDSSFPQGKNHPGIDSEEGDGSPK